ncbi:MAG: DNA gyrase/topoisomerase IV subunit A [Paludibacteraceae bacterium]|nr:DNA gyrase/topoisomerase IV subunit A [Paludibacteraceae bacterium]
MVEDDELTPEESLPSEEAHSNYKPQSGNSADGNKYHLTGMYQDWFLDYASYVILERAVPSIYDGLKPVQRRILHAMKCVDDGKYNKVANIVGQTMQYHPHGDASIGDALVQLGQKDLLIDCQGNWGNILTGDGAAAPRYIEARLSKFALETVFNSKTTHWMKSYDGRKNEPVNLPIKFPLLLAQGVEGIAVGLNSKILPHNFCELCDAAMAYLRGEDFQLFPDFPTGGSIDVSRYNDGERGGVVKIRAKISKIDQKTLEITEIPFGTTVPKLIDSILRANQKGKIKIKKVEDLTAAEADIVITLQPGVSSDKAIDALYAFTDCELSISPNACVIQDKTPIFTSVSNLLKMSADNTRDLLRWELEIHKGELEEQLFYTSLERIFIENRIYKEQGYEQAPNKDALVTFVDHALEPFKAKLIREVRREDIERLFEIRMIRITRFDSKKADELIAELKKKIAAVKHNLAHLTDYTLQWYQGLKDRYGARYPRRTEVRNFVAINATTVVEANEKLYINRTDGFIGTTLKKDEYLFDCSDLDNIIIFYKDGKYKIVKVADKLFVGTNILHLAIFKKNDVRTIYNVVYRDGKAGVYFWKRFNVTGITRDKEYDLTQGKAGSRVVYFTANPNGEAEVIRVQLKPAAHQKKDDYTMDFSELAIKSRSARGNVLSKYDVKSITLRAKGGSTLGGRKVWFDPDVLRINYDGMGMYLGEFQSDDQVLVLTKNGDYYLTSFDLTAHFEDNIRLIQKYDADKVWSLLLWDADQKYYYGKRFQMLPSPKPINFVGENASSRIELLSDREDATFLVTLKDPLKEPLTIVMADFIGVKGATARGKRITTLEVARLEDITPLPDEAETLDNPENTDVLEDLDVMSSSVSVESTEIKEDFESANAFAEVVEPLVETDAVSETAENNTEQKVSEVSESPEAQEITAKKSKKTRKTKMPKVDVLDAEGVAFEIVSPAPVETIPATVSPESEEIVVEKTSVVSKEQEPIVESSISEDEPTTEGKSSKIKKAKKTDKSASGGQMSLF